MPVYSNIPYHFVGIEEFDMSALVAVHNTDLKNRISKTEVLFFNEDGKPVYNFLAEGIITLDPLATKNFYVPYEDKSGTKANFLIEWVSEKPVSEPLVESITFSLKPNHNVGFLSKGKVIRQMR